MTEPLLHRDEREPALDSLGRQIQDAKRAAERVLGARTWTCSDGHEHPRPVEFTHRRLQQEIQKRNPSEPWTWSVVSLAIYKLVDDGTLEQNGTFRLRRGGFDLNTLPDNTDTALPGGVIFDD